MSELNLSVNVYVGDKQVERIYLGDKLVYQVENPPSFTSVGGTESALGEVTLSYEITDGGDNITSIEYDRNDDNWLGVGSTALQGNVVIDELTVGNVYRFRFRARNSVGEAVSSEISVFLGGEFVVWSEDFETETYWKELDDFWRDPNTGAGGLDVPDPIAGGNVRIREKDDTPGRMVQISHIAFNDTQGNFPGTRRLTHPFSYFHLPELTRAVEFSVDWFFETIWDWNTIARDRDEMIQRVLDHGFLIDDGEGGQVLKNDYTQQEAENIVDGLIGGGEEMGPDEPYFETGFPYITGKMHGLISQHDASAPTGGNLPDINEWAVRCTWVKNTQSHPTQGDVVIGGTTFPDTYVDGHDPNVPPKLALYISDQDSTEEETSRHYVLDAFDNMALNTWYTIKIFVQVNDPGKNNGIAKLTVIDRATETELGSVYVDNLKLHDVQDDSGWIHRLDFDTFFGGGTIRYQPKIDPDWADDDLVVTNNGVYCRNDNYVATRFPALFAPVIESESYTGNDIDLEITHQLPFASIDDVEINVQGVGTEYDSENWSSIAYTVTNEVASFTIADVSDDDIIHVRIDLDGRKGARSDGHVVQIPSVPGLPVILDIEPKDQELDVDFAPPDDDGNSEILKYQYRVDGGDPVDLPFSGTDFVVAGFIITEVNGSPLVNEQSYQVEIRAVNAVGAGGWSVPVSEAPISPFTIPITENGLIGYYDPDILELNDTDEATFLEDPSAVGNSLTPPAGNVGPTFRTNIINGQSILRFADNVSLKGEVGKLDTLSNEVTIYLVSSATGQNQKGSVLRTNVWDDTNLMNIHLPYTLSSGGQRVAWDFGDKAGGTGRLLEDFASTFGQFYIWEFRVKPGRMSIYRNGELMYLKTESSTVDLSGMSLRLGLSIEGYFEGDIGLLCMYDRYIETDEQDRLDILNYLATRFDLGVSTPTAPTITEILHTPGDGQVSFDWAVQENGSTLTSIELETNGTWQTLMDAGSNYVDPLGDFTKTGLTNDEQATFRFRYTNGIGSVTSGEIIATPQESVGVRISLESGTDDDKVNSAISKAQSQGVPVLVDGIFTTSGSKNINGPITFQAYEGWEQPNNHSDLPNQKPDATKATIKTNGRWQFLGNTLIDGVYFDGQRNHIRPFAFGVGDILLINGAHFSGCQHGYDDSLAYVTEVLDTCTSFTWDGGSCSDSHSTQPLQGTNVTLNDPDAIRCRGHHVNVGFSGTHTLRNWHLFDVGHELEYPDGDTIWQKPWEDQNWDVDGMDLRGDSENTIHVLENVLLESISGTYIKNSNGGRRYEIDGMTLKVKSGEWQRGRLVRFQDNNGNAPIVSHYSGFARNIVFDIQGTRGKGNDLENTLWALNPQLGVTEANAHMQFENITYKSASYRNYEAIFGTHYRASGNHFIGIKNVTTENPVGWLFRSFRQGRGDHDSSDDGHITFENNVDLNLGEGWFHDAPWRVWSSGCRVYTRWRIKKIGTNSFSNGGTVKNFDFNNHIFEDSGPGGSTPNHVFSENVNYSDGGGSYQSNPCWGGSLTDVRKFIEKT